MHACGGAATLIRDECRQTNGTLLRRYGSDVRCVMGEDAERVTCLSVCMCIVLWPVRVLIECAPPWASPRRPEPNKDPDVRRVYHLPQISSTMDPHDCHSDSMSHCAAGRARARRRQRHRSHEQMIFRSRARRLSILIRTSAFTAQRNDSFWELDAAKTTPRTRYNRVGYREVRLTVANWVRDRTHGWVGLGLG
jgi:hypothetical protein